MPFSPETEDQRPLIDPALIPISEPLESPGLSAMGHPTDHFDPTRFGDWEKKGRCIDF
ncbi:MAG: DUF1674 domain-containing protein [Methylococcaceae bacterium]